MWGLGNGNMVRGVYKGVLFLPMCKTTVLIVCTDSPFYMANLVNKKTLSSISRLKDNPRYTALPSAVAGIIYRLHTDFTLMVGNKGDNCQVTCNSVAKSCDINGLWLLNKECKVVSELFPNCKVFNEVRVKRMTPYTGDMPAARTGGECCTGWPHFLSCYAQNAESARLCTCR